MRTLARVQEERKNMEICVLCWTHLRTVILLPCMHIVMCAKCPKVKECPVCKTFVQSSKTIYK
jgi:hypothetical protein